MNKIPQPIAPGANVRWGNLPGASLAHCLAMHLQQQSGFHLLVTPDNLSAVQLTAALNFFYPKLNLAHFPDWETLPYDVFSPHQDIIADRILCLNQLLLGQVNALVVPISTLMQPVADLDYILANSFSIKKGDKFDIGQTRLRLQQQGYYLVNQVHEHGEYAVRGSIIDIFPTGLAQPLRIELFDDEVDSLRLFDPDTQLSQDKIEQLNLLPAREYPLDEKAISQFRDAWRSEFTGNPMDCPLYHNLSQGIALGGIEYYLPLFFDKVTHLLAYLPENTQVIRIEDCASSAEQFWHEITERYQLNNIDRTRPLLAPDKLFLPADKVLQALNRFAQIMVTQAPVALKNTGCYNFDNYHALPDLATNYKANQPLEKLHLYLQTHQDKTLFITESAGRRQALLDLLHKITLYPKVCDTWAECLTETSQTICTVAPLSKGFFDAQTPLSIITESELFGEKVFVSRVKKQKQIDSDLAIRDLAELQIDSPVVHIDHGIGRFAGLTTLNAGGITQEFLVLEYAGSDKLYVPVTNLHLIGRYSGMNPDHAPLHRLGSGHWDKEKQKAAEKARDVAAELLEIYAKREAKSGFAFKVPDSEYYRFAASFPFEETPDQAVTIENVLADMQKAKPMDRLVCGDVGFGKTEVAMRAAFIAAQSNKQVAILVPTTLLAEQHYQNFKDRFADWPINVECLSRFRTNKQQQEIIAKISEGKVDIIIGTHKLLQPTIKFHDLGLLIIDEEHRFGVGQKEKIKAYRSEVDILTLTATPIPRTLNMSMAGIRELSLIATAPAKRLSVKTFVQSRGKTIIREAILREILRGGQVYFLHNNIDTIENIAFEITNLIPEAKVKVAHGQMRERELERVMSDFYHQRFNVLVCTTIIETGIDIPTANTMIIDDADHFGVAQLHQLRGRVGRSHHQAYAYLLTPPDAAISRDAKKRLEAISAYDDLGVGFMLATHDLEIRGAGDFLGEEQSGNIQAIGFTLYMELLDRTVKALKAGKELNLSLTDHGHIEIDLKISALIPDDYLSDVHQRLVLYKRLASAKDEDTLQELKIEIIDRFGSLPEPLKNLLQIHQMKIKAGALGIRKIEGGNMGGILEFAPNPSVDPKKIIQLIQTQPQKYKLEHGNRLRYSLKSDTAAVRLMQIGEVLQELRS